MSGEVTPDMKAPTDIEETIVKIELVQPKIEKDFDDFVFDSNCYNNGASPEEYDGSLPSDEKLLKELTSDDVAIEKDTSHEDCHTCTQCKKAFKNNDSLKEHMTYCVKSENDIVKHECKLCDFETKWQSNLMVHVWKRHQSKLGKDEEPIDRPNEEKTQKTKKDTVSQKSNELEKHKCQFCDFETKWKNHLLIHMCRRHRTGSFKLSQRTVAVDCPGCGKTYTNDECVKKHMKICEKLNDEVIKHKCKFCDFETKYQSGLTLHTKRVHPAGATERPVCTACGKSYKHEEGVKRHRCNAKKGIMEPSKANSLLSRNQTEGNTLKSTLT